VGVAHRAHRSRTADRCPRPAGRDPMSGSAEIYADHETGTVCIEFSGGQYVHPDTGRTETVEPTAVTLDPEVAREMAYRITLASYALERTDPDE
jgi:hypothetical protein